MTGQSLPEQSSSPTFEELVAILTDSDVLAGKHLPQAEQDEHRRCVRSVVEARRWAEAHAHEFYVGGYGL